MSFDSFLDGFIPIKSTKGIAPVKMFFFRKSREAETIAVKQLVIRINKNDFPYEVVRSRFEKIDYHTMEYVLECLRNNTAKVRNIRSYMLTTLYNAPVTCSNYYKAEVNHDFYGQ